jgi:hypothetical protein
MAQEGPEPGSMDVIGEALAAVTGGLERVMAEKMKAIPASAQEKAIQLLRTLPKRVELALNGKADDGERLNRETPEGDYLECLGALTDPKKVPKPNERADLVADLERAFSAPYTMWFDRAFATGAQLIPRRTYRTIFGIQAVEPSGSELGAWWRAWDVARDPMVIVDRIADGTLITDEVTALAQFYPGIKGKMTVAAVLGLANLRAKEGPDWLPADVTQRTVECLLGFSPLSQELATQLQNAAAAARQGEADKNADAMASGPGIEGPKMETPTQRIADR